MTVTFTPFSGTGALVVPLPAGGLDDMLVLHLYSSPGATLPAGWHGTAYEMTGTLVYGWRRRQLGDVSVTVSGAGGAVGHVVNIPLSESPWFSGGSIADPPFIVTQLLASGSGIAPVAESFPNPDPFTGFVVFTVSGSDPPPPVNTGGELDPVSGIALGDVLHTLWLSEPAGAATSFIADVQLDPFGELSHMRVGFRPTSQEFWVGEIGMA